MTVKAQIEAIASKWDLQFHTSFLEFVEQSVSLYGEHPTSISMNELKAWPGVSVPGAQTAPPSDEDSEEYWIHDIAELFGIPSIDSEFEEDYFWTKPLAAVAYPVARGYGGGVFFQSNDGEIWHGWGDEWLEDEDHQEIADAGLNAFCAEWGHHYIASDYKEFYRMLCEQRGAS